MISEYKHKRVTWLDMESPTAEEVKKVMAKYSIHPLVADELLRPTLRPKADYYKDLVYLVLHFPVLKPDGKGFEECEIDFILSKNFLITVHYKPLISLTELGKIFEADAMLEDGGLAKNAGILFFYVIKHLYDISMDYLEDLQMQIQEIEDRMFEKKPSQYNLVRKISHVRRDLIDLRRMVQPHKSILGSIEYTCIKFFGKEFSHYLSRMLGEHYKLWNVLENDQEIVASIQDTNDSILNNWSNEIMKILTIIAFITFPLTLLSSIFGMNTKYIPIVGLPGDFWIIIGIMILATVLMFYFFKKKKWV